MIALLASLVLALATAVAASLTSRITARSGSARLCLAGLMAALFLRLAGLSAVAVLVHICWPTDLILGLGAAAGVVMLGLVLDVRHLLRTVRTSAEERVRA